MAVRRLENRDWGFDTNCFVCEPANARGLAIPFFFDDEAAVVTAEFTLGPEFSGVPRYVHGGVVLAVLDEAMAWAAIAVAERFAVVHQTATTFDRPVRVGRAYRVTASVQTATADRRHRPGRGGGGGGGRPPVRRGPRPAGGDDGGRGRHRYRRRRGTRPLPAKMRA